MKLAKMEGKLRAEEEEEEEEVQNRTLAQEIGQQK
jgi:hypothetical protein